MSSQFLKRAVSTTLVGTSLFAIYYQARNYDTPFGKNKMLPSYEANFQVPMHCDACIKDISGALSALPGIVPASICPHENPRADLSVLGIQSTSFSLPSQIVSIKGCAPPSAVIKTIQCSGRTAILRGTGASDSVSLSSPAPRFNHPTCLAHLLRNNLQPNAFPGNRCSSLHPGTSPSSFPPSRPVPRAWPCASNSAF